MTESFILGLSSGSACLVTCGMVMFPYLMAGSAGVKRVVADVSIFLLVRLAVYLILATLIWYLGQRIITSPILKTWISGSLYILFAIMLIWYSIGRNRYKECPAGIISEVENKRMIPVVLGVVNSLGFCPALLLMLTRSSGEDSILKCWMVFLAFFAGSSLWFLPLPLTGKLRKKDIIRTVGVFATALAGIIFIIKGITIILGGLIYG